MPKKIIAWVNENDEAEMRKHKYKFVPEFVQNFNDLPDAAFYIVSLKKASEICDEFVSFMRARPESKFFFLDIGDEVFEDEDYTIRDEPNAFHDGPIDEYGVQTGHSMFYSDSVFELIKKLKETPGNRRHTEKKES